MAEIIIAVLLFGYQLFCNLIVTKTDEDEEDFIDDWRDQPLVGKVCMPVYYWLAFLLIGIKKLRHS